MSDIICKSRTEETEARTRLDEACQERARLNKQRRRRGGYYPDFFHVSVERNSDLIEVSKRLNGASLSIEQAKHLHSCLGEAIAVAEANVGKPDPYDQLDDGSDFDPPADYYVSRLINLPDFAPEVST